MTQLLNVRTVQRLNFGEVLTPSMPTGEHKDHGPAYIIGLGKRPKTAKGTLTLVKDSSKAKEPASDFVADQLPNIMVELKKHALPIEEGPYQDRVNAVAMFSDVILKDVARDDLIGTIERIIDTRPMVGPEMEAHYPRMYRTNILNFYFNRDFSTNPGVLPNAGELLSQLERRVEDSSTGASSHVLAHPFEPYIIATSILRRRGFEAYPGQAVFRRNPMDPATDEYSPLMIIVDLAKEIPVTTFMLLRDHPPMGSVDIFSDIAVRGAQYAMAAEARTKFMTALRMHPVLSAGKDLRAIRDEIASNLASIGDSLFQCHKAWPGCPFVVGALNFLAKDVYELMVGTGAQRQGIQHPADPRLEGIRQNASAIADRFVDKVQKHFSTLIATSAAELPATPDPKASGS